MHSLGTLYYMIQITLRKGKQKVLPWLICTPKRKLKLKALEVNLSINLSNVWILTFNLSSVNVILVPANFFSAMFSMFFHKGILIKAVRKKATEGGEQEKEHGKGSGKWWYFFHGGMGSVCVMFHEAPLQRARTQWNDRIKDFGKKKNG